MITAPAARRLFTAVFGAARLTAALPRRGPSGTAAGGPDLGRLVRRDVRGPDRHDLAPEPAAATWSQAALPGCAAPGFGPTSRAGAPVPVLTVSIVLAVSCAAASFPWLARAIGPGPRVKDPVSASQAAMNAGMAAMLLATLG